MMEELTQIEIEDIKVPKNALIKLSSNEELTAKWLNKNYRLIQQAFEEGEYQVMFGPTHLDSALAMKDYLNQRNPERYPLKIKGPLPTTCAFDPDTILEITREI